MEHLKKEKVVGISFLVIVYGAFIGLVINVGLSVLGISKNVEELPKVSIDYEKLYPFEAEETKVEENLSDANENVGEQTQKAEQEPLLTKSYQNLLNKFSVYTNKLETYSYAHCPFRNGLIDVWSVMNKIKGDVIIDQEIEIVKLTNDKLSYVYPELNSNGQAEVLGEFAEELETEGIDFLYVSCPFKIEADDKKLPFAVEDNTNEGVDKFLDELRDENVKVMDLRENIKNQNINYESMFYITDHHWTTEAGVWAAGEIAQYMNDNFEYSFSVDKLSEANWNKQVYPSWYAGSQGKKTGIGYVKADDFVLLTPKFDTEFDVEILSRNYKNSGTFTETLYDDSQIQEKNYYLYNLYNGYMYDDNPLTQIHNKSVQNGKRVLILKDSFALAVIPFFASADGAEYIDVIDLRWFNGSLKTFMKENSPDSVIMIYNPGMLTYTEYQDNHNNPWNVE